MNVITSFHEREPMLNHFDNCVKKALPRAGASRLRRYTASPVVPDMPKPTGEDAPGVRIISRSRSHSV